MTRLFICGMICVLASTSLFAQNNKLNTGILRGVIITSDSLPASFVTIEIDHSPHAVMTNDRGEYIIRNIAPGTWTVKVTAVSAISEQREITIVARQTRRLDFVLKENAAQLLEVVVSAKNLNRENRFVAKMPLKNLENPQVYNTVSSELMKQQGITNYDDAMRNVPGISRTWESTGRAGDGASYFALRGFDAQPALTNGLPGLTSGNLDPSNVEEIEVLKGPSGTLFGGSFYSYGGIINTVTKKPYFTTGGEFSCNFGSFGLNRITADINTPLSKTEKIALRVNVACHSENSFQDAGFKNSFFISPSLLYEVNAKLSFRFLAEILQEERAVAPVFFNSNRFDRLDFKTVADLKLNNDLSFTSNDLTIKNPRFNMQGQMLYKLPGGWTSQTVFSRGTVKSKGIYTYIWDDVAGDNDFSQYFHNENQITTTTDIQQNFNGDFKIGKLRNRLLVGLDYFNTSIIDNGSGWGWARNVTPQGDVTYVNPFILDTLPPVYLSKPSIDNLLAGIEGIHSNISNTTFAAYAADVLTITPGILAMASLRADYFDSKGEKSAGEDNFHQVALSPKFGLVYQPVIDRVSLFVSYMNAFINVAPQQVSDADGGNGHLKSFKPEHADQWEFGIKTNLLSGKLGVTISVYDIKVANRVMPDPANPLNAIQGGKVGSKGFEIDINATPAKGLNLVAGYSHNKTRVIAGDKTDFYSEPGRSIGGQGPGELANFWATYKFSGRALRNFGLSLGGNYAGIYKVIDNSATGVFELPSYTLINGAIFYNAGRFRIGLNVNNITDEVYYIGYWSINPQRPRNFTASFTYKF